MGAEALRIGVEEADHVAIEHGQGAPHRVALAEYGAELGHQLVLVVDLGAEAAGDVSGAVGRAVDDHDLVDDAGLAQRYESFEDWSDRASLVARGQAHRHRAVALRGEPLGREIAVRKGVRVLPGPRSDRHLQRG